MRESATGCAVSDHSSDMYWRSLYTDYSTHNSLGGRYAAQGELKETGARQSGSLPFRLQARKRQIKGSHQAAWLQSLPSGPAWAALAEVRTPRRLSQEQFWLAAAHPPLDSQGLLCSMCSHVPPQAYLVSQLVHSSQQRMSSLCLFTYWNIIALQSCVNICCTMEWISYMYPYVPSLLSLPSTMLIILPICVITEHWVELPVLYGMFPLATYFPHNSVYAIAIVVQSPSCVWLFATPWTIAHQAALPLTISQSMPKFMSIASVMPSSHLILWCPLLLLPSIFHSIWDFSKELAVCIRWPKYWSFSFSISLSNEYLGLISFKIDWLDLPAVQGTLRSLLQRHRLKASILWRSAFFMVQLSEPYMTTGKTIALTIWRSCIYVNPNLPICPTLPFPLCPHICYSCLHVYSCPANRFICTKKTYVPWHSL